MKHLPAVFLIALSILFASCSDDDTAGGTTGSSGSTGTTYPPVTNMSTITPANYTAYSVTLPPGGFYILTTTNYRQPLANTATDWWHDAVIYQVYSAAFNSGALPTSKLDYLTNIGFDAVWSTPIFQSPSEHGYDTTDYYTVKPGYGGNSGLDTYVAAAHQRSVKVILDMVLNHTGSGHSWFSDSKNNANGKRDWYVWTNTRPDGWGRPWGGGTSSDVWIAYGGAYYYAAFWDGMPDLNLANPDVRAAVKTIADFWIGKGVDGFRLDAARYAIETGGGADQADTPETKAWWSEYQAHLVSSNSSFYTVGEFWTDTLSDLDGYYSSGNGLNQGFSFQFYYAVVNSLRNGDAGYLESYINDLNSRTAPHRFFAPFLDNHDEPDHNNRFMDSIAGSGNQDVPLAKAGAAVLLTMPGTPYVYYGTEIGMNHDTGMSGDAAKRRPMNWAAVTGQLADPGSLLNTWKRLIAVRREEPALRRGSLTLLNTAGNAVVGWLRPGPDRSVIVLVNLTGNEVSTTVDFTGSGLSSSATHYLDIKPVGSALGSLSNTNVVYNGNYPAMYVRGDFNGWGSGNPMVLIADNTWRTTVGGLSGGELFKFEATGEAIWGTNWGDNNGDGIAGQGEGNITNSLSGTVTFTFHDQTLGYSLSN